MKLSFSFGIFLFLAAGTCTIAMKRKVIKDALCLGWCKIKGFGGYVGGERCICKTTNPLNSIRESRRLELEEVKSNNKGGDSTPKKNTSAPKKKTSAPKRKSSQKTGYRTRHTNESRRAQRKQQ